MNKKIITLGLVFITFFSSIAYATNLNQLERNYSTKLLYNFDANSYLPPNWFRPPVSARYTLLRRSEMSRVLRAFESFAQEYPTTVIKNNLKGVLFFKRLNFYGTNYGASYWDGYILMKCARGNSTKYIVREFHHEFSSILIDRYDFDMHKWFSLGGTKYNFNQHSFLRHGLWGRDEHKRLFRQGFLTSYGKSNPENDVNIYAEYLFVYPKRLQKLSKKYPRIHNKTKMIKGFYCSIDNKFHFCQ